MSEVLEDLDEIIELADKVDYDTTKLLEYQKQLKEFQNEYNKFT